MNQLRFSFSTHHLNILTDNFGGGCFFPLILILKMYLKKEKSLVKIKPLHSKSFSDLVILLLFQNITLKKCSVFFKPFCAHLGWKRMRIDKTSPGVTLANMLRDITNVSGQIFLHNLCLCPLALLLPMSAGGRLCPWPRGQEVTTKREWVFEMSFELFNLKHNKTGSTQKGIPFKHFPSAVSSVLCLLDTVYSQPRNPQPFTHSQLTANMCSARHSYCQLYPRLKSRWQSLNNPFLRSADLQACGNAHLLPHSKQLFASCSVNSPM